MRRLRVNQERGFTLVEVLVISPIVILFIGAFIALAVGLTGESLQVREKNASVYDVQDALNTMEANVVQTTGFMASTTGVQSPQGKNNSATQFTDTNGTDPDTLILKIPATNRRPTDPARSLIYMGTGACNNKNPIYTYTAVFFVDTTTHSLYKRTILPQTPACDLPWQRASCNANDIATNGSICKAQDEKLLDNVTGMQIQYYADATSTTALDPATQASSATSVNITLTTQKQIGGSTINYSSSLRTSSLNVQTSDVNTTPPTTPAIAWSRDNLNSPYTTTFSWDKVGSATGYNIRYRLGSSTWVNGPQNQSPTNTSYSVVGNARKQNEDIEVTVVTSSGTYLYGTSTPPALPSWNECTPLNGWANYDTTYNTLGFTKTISGAIGLKGLIKSGPVGYNESYAVCNLPAGFRPANHLIFNGVAYDPNGVGSNGSARIDIWPDGNIVVTSGSNTAYTNGFVSLDGIIFLAPDSGVSWQAGTWVSPWYYNSYSDTYPNLGFWRDSRGRTWMQGLGTGGGGQTVTMNVPAGMAPTNGSLHYNIDTNNIGGAINVTTSSTWNSRASNGYYISTQLLFYSTGGLHPMTLYNGWVNYGSGWSTAMCYQGSDDIVIIQGLVASGTNGVAMSHVGVCGATPYMSTGRRALFPAWINWETQGRIDMPTDNYLYPIASNTGWTSMDAIHYIAN